MRELRAKRWRAVFNLTRLACVTNHSSAMSVHEGNTIRGATVREALSSTAAPEAAAGLSQPSSLQSSLVLVSSIWITSDPASTHLRSA